MKGGGTRHSPNLLPHLRRASGLAALPVEVASTHVGDYARPGDHVDVLAGPSPDVPELADRPGSATVVADHAVVLAVLPGRDDGASTIVIAADRGTALSIIRQGMSGVFTVAVDAP